LTKLQRVKRWELFLRHSVVTWGSDHWASCQRAVLLAPSLASHCWSEDL